MNKNLKKIIAFTIICTAFSAWVPSTIHIGTQFAYAYSSDELSSLKITSGVSIIPIYTSKSYKYDYRVENGNNIPIIVFSKISSAQTNVKLNTLETKAADIRVFVGKDDVKLNDIYSEIQIGEGETKSIYVRLYNSKASSDSDFTAEYEVVVQREAKSEDENVVDSETSTIKEYGDVYLNALVLSNDNKKIDFNFDKTQSIYNINVDESVSYIKIKADPEQDGYKLRIDDKEIATKGDDKDIRDVQLDKGTNSIKIRVIGDNSEKREYFLNVTRGKNTATSTETTTSNNTTSDPTTNNTSSQNVQTGAAWQYRKADGTIAIGWTSIGNEWYYFDSTGALKTGWLQDGTGKWYYLKESGAMAKDTMIAGYKLGSDGVCIIK